MTEQTGGEPTQVYHVLIKAAAQRIWDALIKPEFTTRYFYGVRVETTGEAGAPFRHLSSDGETVLIDETVLESDPPLRLAVSWRPLYDRSAHGDQYPLTPVHGSVRGY